MIFICKKLHLSFEKNCFGIDLLFKFINCLFLIKFTLKKNLSKTKLPWKNFFSLKNFYSLKIKVRISCSKNFLSPRFLSSDKEKSYIHFSLIWFLFISLFLWVLKNMRWKRKEEKNFCRIFKCCKIQNCFISLKCFKSFIVKSLILSFT